MRRILVIVVCVLAFFDLKAQTYINEFGQNRIQYKEFDWYFYSTNNFDIYYYEGGGDYAEQALEFLEDEFNRLTDILGYAPYAKTKIFLYNSIHDLQQSNKGIDGATFTIGGQTDFIKLQMEVAHPGTATGFREEIVYRFARILIEDMMFGGSLAEIFQSAYLLSLPRWFIDGAARYLAYGWSTDMDDHIRDYIGHQRIKKLVKIEGDEAGIVGQSIWNYISLIYGKSNISNVLNLTRIIRNEKTSISSTLGLDYKQFLADWQNYYLLAEEEILEDHQDPIEEDEIHSKNNHELKYNNVRISPSGKKIAYSINNLGKYAVYVSDRETGKRKKVLKGGIIVPGQKVDEDLPLLDWVDDDRLGAVYYKRGLLYISLINVQTGEKTIRPLSRFKQIKSFSFNDNGRLAVLSADVDGRNDLYLISMRRSAVRRITADIYDDLDPAFIPGTAAVVFSSNRDIDSLGVGEVALENVGDNFNLFIYDLDTTRNAYYRLTNSVGNDIKPIAKNETEIFYLTDEKGIYNLYKYSFRDSVHHQVSNFSKSLKDYDLHFDEDGITFLMLDDGLDRIYYNNQVDFNGNQFTQPTPRQRYGQAEFVANRFSNDLKLSLEQDSASIAADSLVNDPDAVDTEDFVFAEEFEFEVDTTFEDNANFVDTEDFVFDEETEGDYVNNYRPDSFFSNFQKFEQSSEVIGPVPYIPRFSFSSLVTSFAIDPLRGFGIHLETQITDMLENHKLKGGALAITDLRSGDVFAEYQYLKHRIDFKARFDSRLLVVREDQENQLVQRYALNKFEIGASLPISNWVRVEFNPFYARTSFRNLQFAAVNTINNVPDLAQDNNVHYGGFNAAAVFDNTIERGFNLTQGTRGRVEFRQYTGVSESNRSFGNIRVDLRHYQKIHREITLATRFFYGQFVGTNKQTYLLGGVPNWLFNRTNRGQVGDPLVTSNETDNSNILFVEYVTKVRGFDYGELFGSSSMVFNAELRIPVFDYFSRGPVNSTFLRNFQLVGFYDIGSAWDGAIPLTRDNSATEIRFEQENSPFTADIANFRNPWLAGLGGGLRMVLFGYYAKLDVARPIRDFEFERTRFYVSVGLDF